MRSILCKMKTSNVNSYLFSELTLVKPDDMPQQYMDREWLLLVNPELTSVKPDAMPQKRMDKENCCS